MAERLSWNGLPCPECRVKGKKGMARIGNRRNTCATCNNFVQNVMRLTRKRLKELHEDEYEAIRIQVELDLYPQVIEDFIAVNGPLGLEVDMDLVMGSDL